MDKMRNPETDRLFQVILNLESIDECYDFFEDICTVKELQSISQRWEVAELLNKNVSYQEISKKTGASTATISRVNKCLVYGRDGYTSALQKIAEKGQKND